MNPNCLYIRDLVMTSVGQTVVSDIFQGSGRDHARLLRAIKKRHRVQSFATGKTVTMKNVTEHHAEGNGPRSPWERRKKRGRSGRPRIRRKGGG
ncbi:MAG: hypothetical protein JXO51_06430 [Candidatus Aminicenantes bacterium]|nr:hypothetical protein [Candidatus Aminicenantes bacterium]